MDTWMGNSSDPITLHKYAYGNLNPINNIDPSGQFSIASVGIAHNIRMTLTNIQVDVGFSFFDSIVNQEEMSSSSIGFSVIASMLPLKLTTKIRFFKNIKEFNFTNGSVIRYSKKNLPEAKELKAAKFLAKNRQVSIFLRGTNVKGADAIMNGHVYEIKTLDKATHSAVKNNLQEAKRRNKASRVIIDGRKSGITYDEAYRGIRRAEGVKDNPDHLYLLLNEGIFEFYK